MMTISSIIGDNEMDPMARERVSHAVLDVVERRTSKGTMHASDGRHDPAEER